MSAWLLITMKLPQTIPSLGLQGCTRGKSGKTVRMYDPFLILRFYVNTEDFAMQLCNAQVKQWWLNQYVRKKLNVITWSEFYCTICTTPQTMPKPNRLHKKNQRHWQCWFLFFLKKNLLSTFRGPNCNNPPTTQCWITSVALLLYLNKHMSVILAKWNAITTVVECAAHWDIGAAPLIHYAAWQQLSHLLI